MPQTQNWIQICTKWNIYEKLLPSIPSKHLTKKQNNSDSSLLCHSLSIAELQLRRYIIEEAKIQFNLILLME